MKGSLAGEEILQWHDQEFALLPQRAVWWPAQRMLLIADPHFGKAATFRAASIPMPDVTATDLRRLDELLEYTEAKMLTILGDLLHARQGRCPTVFESIRGWRTCHPDLRIQLILGNHDLRAGRPPADWNFECVTEPASIAKFQLRHHPDFAAETPILAGHLHPKVKLQSTGDTIVAPGFLLRGSCLVLPAFGSLIDSQVIPSQPGDAWYVIADREVCRLPIVG